ncbi:MAG: DUF2510 domain-containing protein, partial [Nocardioidaceae bacterium]|nr:DUF2510 domain-containing protein [Nocardioidaceae bacterium]
MPEAAWHPDPTGRHELRYWDGNQWTEHVADQGVQSTSPVVMEPAADQGAAGSAGAHQGVSDVATQLAPQSAQDPYASDQSAPEPAHVEPAHESAQAEAAQGEAGHEEVAPAEAAQDEAAPFDS